MLSFFLGFVALFGAFSGSSTWADDSVMEMSLPCRSGANDQANAALRLCSDVSASEIQMVQSRIQGLSVAYYNGCSRDPSSPQNSVPCSADAPKDIPTTKNICNVYPSPFNQISQSGETQDSCGDWAAPTVSATSKECIIKVPQERIYRKTSDGYKNTREGSYLSGARIHGYDCQFSRIRAQIQSGKVLLKSATAQTVYQTSYLPLLSRLTSQKNIKEIEHCANPTDQSSCKLEGVRAKIEALFAHISVLEAFANATADHELLKRNMYGIETRILNGKVSVDCTSTGVASYYRAKFLENFHTESDKIWTTEACSK